MDCEKMRSVDRHLDWLSVNGLDSLDERGGWAVGAAVRERDMGDKAIRSYVGLCIGDRWIGRYDLCDGLTYDFANVINRLSRNNKQQDRFRMNDCAVDVDFKRGRAFALCGSHVCYSVNRCGVNFVDVSNVL